MTPNPSAPLLRGVKKTVTTGYTARIRLKRDGRLVHTQTETFSRKALAQEWLTRHEAELQGQRARGEPIGQRMTIAEMVTWYEGHERPEDLWGHTKQADLAALRTCDPASKRVDRLIQQDFIEQIERHRKTATEPATVSNDLIWLRQVFKTAQAVLGVAVPLAALDEAAEFLRQHRMIGKPKLRGG